MEIEWPLVLFSLLAGCGGCAFAYVGVSELAKTGEKGRFPITIVALALTIVGGCCSVAHLAAPQNVMAAVWNIGSLSGISVELIMIGVTVIVMLVYLVALKRGASSGACAAIGVVGIIAGLLLAFFTGHGYVIQSQAAWDTELLPVAYLGTSLALGAFVYLVSAVALSIDEAQLGRIAVPVGVGALIGAVTIVCYVLAVGFDKASTEPVVLWLGLIVCGVAVTAVCGVLVLMRKTLGNPWVVPCVGLVAALVGALCLRVFMWLMGSGFLELFSVASGPRIMLG